MKPSEAFFAGSRYAIFGACARGRMHGPILIAALNKAGKAAVAIETDDSPVKGAPTCRTLAEAGAVDGAVLLPPDPWDDVARGFVKDAIGQCRSAGLERVWIYTADDPAQAVHIAEQAGVDPAAGRCPCLYIPSGGFPHNLHRGLLRLVRQL